ncbi:MAG: FAD:protein FMN transferase [Bacteroidota bacterium]|nr:FAD:protein FMN transferase [Bacteroidota bacterium]
MDSKKKINIFNRRDFLKLSGILIAGKLILPSKIFSAIKQPSKVLRSTFTMGSIVTVEAHCDDKVLCNLAINEAFNEMKTIDKLMSVFDDSSQVSLINNFANSEAVKVDSRIIELIKYAQDISQRTDGNFDITVEPLMQLYGFRSDDEINEIPSDKKLNEVLSAVGMENIVINENESSVFLNNSKTKIDFGGVAVGYAMDRAVSILKSYGIESAFINHSGDIFAIGSPPEEAAWKIGVIDPTKQNDIVTTINLKDEALATSGNYSNFVKIDSRRVGHILNPKKGMLDENFLNFSITAPKTIEADALTTGLFVFDIEKANSFFKLNENLKYIAVLRDCNIVKNY